MNIQNKAKRWWIGLVAVFCLLLGTQALALTTETMSAQALQDSMLYSSMQADQSVGMVKKGETVTVLEESGEWLRVQSGAKRGYTSAKNFRILSVIQNYDPSLRGRITADSVNLRQQPTLESAIVTTLKKGSVVEVLEKTDNWYKIAYGKQVGYVNTSYVSLGNAGGDDDEYSTLSMGMSSVDVGRMQQALTDLGYYNGPVNGSFGARTRDAVKAFQEANGLYPDGVARPATLKLIYDQQAARTA